MKEISIYIRVVITILGLAYPILLQVTARLDEKYDSVHLVGLFEKESINKWFKRMLIFSLLMIFIWTFKLQPKWIFNDLNIEIINNSANWLVLISSTILVVLFFSFVKKVLTYYTPNKLINYLIKKHKANDSNNLKCFNALSDILIHYVKKSNYEQTETISRYFSQVYYLERENQIGQPVVYPEDYYISIHNTIEELSKHSSKRNEFLEYATTSGVLLLGGNSDHEISIDTYSWLWENILLAIDYNKDSFIVQYWKNAHQYYENILISLNEIRDKDNNLLNQDQIEKRNAEREQFLEFHYVLGGLLMYKKRYACIYKIFNYTTQEPAKYVLLPKTMTEVFNKLMEFRNHFQYHSISFLYRFPELSGLNSDAIIRKWISEYFAVLFLRQYTINPYLITMRPIDPPNLPESQAAKKEWINSMDFFKKLVEKHLSNKSLIEDLEWQNLTKENFEKSKTTFPLSFIDDLKTSIEARRTHDAAHQELDPEKVNLFYERSQTILEEIFNEAKLISQKELNEDNISAWNIKTEYQLYQREAFLRHPEVHHVDYESYYARKVANHVQENINFSIQNNTTKKYLLKPEDIFKGIKQIGVNSDYVIINFGIDLSTYIGNYNNAGLTDNQFHDTRIINIKKLRGINHSIFVLKKEHLPSFSYSKPEEEIITKYDLEEKSNEFNLFMRVLDHTEFNVKVKNEILQIIPKDEIEKSVLLVIKFLLEIRWKKTINLIQFIEFSEYRQKGLPNDLSDIERLEKISPIESDKTKKTILRRIIEFFGLLKKKHINVKT